MKKPQPDGLGLSYLSERKQAHSGRTLPRESIGHACAAKIAVAVEAIYIADLRASP
jgi:hypothetical protein